MEDIKASSLKALLLNPSLMAPSTPRVYLGSETVTHRQGPACNSHCGEYDTAVGLINSLVDGEDHVTMSDYMFNGSLNDVTATYTEMYVDVIDLSRIACYAKTGTQHFDFSFDNSEEFVVLYWYFPGKGKWVPLGKARSLELLRQYQVVMPVWLEDYLLPKKKPSYPTEGNGWKLL